jgi:hypothetical protein
MELLGPEKNLLIRYKDGLQAILNADRDEYTFVDFQIMLPTKSGNPLGAPLTSAVINVLRRAGVIVNVYGAKPRIFVVDKKKLKELLDTLGE